MFELHRTHCLEGSGQEVPCIKSTPQSHRKTPGRLYSSTTSRQTCTFLDFFLAARLMRCCHHASHVTPGFTGFYRLQGLSPCAPLKFPQFTLIVTGGCTRNATA